MSIYPFRWISLTFYAEWIYSGCKELEIAHAEMDVIPKYQIVMENRRRWQSMNKEYEEAKAVDIYNRPMRSDFIFPIRSFVLVQS